jgi:hypothetical protein
MYKVALQKSLGDSKLEPMAICNYATFIFKHKKDHAAAKRLFKDGLHKFALFFIEVNIFVDI